jgi:predicted subunit of tRNA(5-methylaminomethyl-2-thiouridylate) methyltransferase
MAEKKFEIDVENNIDYVNSLIDLHSKDLDSKVLEILKMLRDTKPHKISKDDYESIFDWANFYEELATDLYAIVENVEITYD